MSTGLYWRPIPIEPKEHSLGWLKHDLHAEVWGTDGNDASCGHGPTKVGRELLPFLRGVIAGGSEDKAHSAQMLIEAIEEHGEVEILIH